MSKQYKLECPHCQTESIFTCEYYYNNHKCILCASNFDSMVYINIKNNDNNEMYVEIIKNSIYNYD